MSTLNTIEKAIETVEAIAHFHSLKAETATLLEYAGAYLQEAWISESGQIARNPERVKEDVTFELGSYSSIEEYAG